MARLAEAVALVTGGAQGIGRSFVEHLLEEGAKVAIGDLPNSTGSTTQAELNEKYPQKIIFVHCDVTDPKTFEEAVKATIGKFGSLNILVNNAGICDESERGWPTMIRINVDGVVTGTKLGLKYMGKENGGNGGTVINIASLTTFIPWDPIPVYAATKAFVNQFSRCYGKPVHYDTSGVKVIAINPGLTDTAILVKAAEGIIKDTDAMRECFRNFITEHPVQEVSNLGRGLITVLKEGKNGSMWAVENDEPARELTLQYSDV